MTGPTLYHRKRFKNVQDVYYCLWKFNLILSSNKLHPQNIQCFVMATPLNMILILYR